MPITSGLVANIAAKASSGLSKRRQPNSPHEPSAIVGAAVATAATLAEGFAEATETSATGTEVAALFSLHAETTKGNETTNAERTNQE